MSAAFFEGLNLPEPNHNLRVGSGSHGSQTGRMLEALERVMLEERPDWVLVYGDTNSTLAGALAAAKLHIPVAHVEAGLRSYNRRMPEEINRVVTDHLAALLFAPTDASVKNLTAEGSTRGVYKTGDVMYDLFLKMKPLIDERAPRILDRFDLRPKEYAFVTAHRAENTDDPARWSGILTGLASIARNGLRVIWPVHPRTRELVERVSENRIRFLEPLPYLETHALLSQAKVVLTDSGGLRKEAAFHGVPCITMRDETEWVELVEAGVNVLAGTDPARIVHAARAATWPTAGLPPDLYGRGDTAAAIAGILLSRVPDKVC